MSALYLPSTNLTEAELKAFSMFGDEISITKETHITSPSTPSGQDIFKPSHCAQITTVAIDIMFATQRETSAKPR